MSNDKTVSDEMLMAMADGEVSGEEAEAILSLAESDPDVRRRLEFFRETRGAARDAFAPVLEETPPAHLAAAIRRQPEAGWRAAMNASPEHRSIASWMALAAAVIAAAGIGYFMGGGGAIVTPWAPALEGQLLVAVNNLPSGERVTLDLGGDPLPFEMLATYPVEDGVCRLFALGGSEPLRAVACNSGEGWHLALAAAENATGYLPASGNAVEAVEAWLSGVDAGAALPPDAEADLINRNWPAAR